MSLFIFFFFMLTARFTGTPQLWRLIISYLFSTHSVTWAGGEQNRARTAAWFAKPTSGKLILSNGVK